MRFTVLGSSGFIGSHVAQLALRRGHDVICPQRDEDLTGHNLGHVIYAIGLTADFRQRPHDTVTAHVTKLQEVLTRTSFESLVYLSSTRVYARSAAISPVTQLPIAISEDAPIRVVSTDFSDLYNISKLMGESIALTYGTKVKIARLSNVIGLDLTSDNFLMSVVRDCLLHGFCEFKTAMNSAKDYVSVEDVADILLRLGREGQNSIYNVGSGTNTLHQEIASQLSRLTGAGFGVSLGSPTVTFPRIDISRLQQEFRFVPKGTDAMICSLVSGFRSHLSQQSGKHAA